MWLRAVAIWLVLLVLAVLNGGLRTALLVPHLGEHLGHVGSSVILCVLIAAVARVAIGWMGPVTRTESWGIGALWLVLTLAFEFLAGHYLFGDPWDRLLADYDVLRGRIWVLVLLVTLLAPPWAARRL